MKSSPVDLLNSETKGGEEGEGEKASLSHTASIPKPRSSVKKFNGYAAQGPTETERKGRGRGGGVS